MPTRTRRHAAFSGFAATASCRKPDGRGSLCQGWQPPWCRHHDRESGLTVNSASPPERGLAARSLQFPCAEPSRLADRRTDSDGVVRCELTPSRDEAAVLPVPGARALAEAATEFAGRLGLPRDGAPTGALQIQLGRWARCRPFSPPGRHPGPIRPGTRDRFLRAAGRCYNGFWRTRQTRRSLLGGGGWSHA